MIEHIEIHLEDGRVFYVNPSTIYPDLADVWYAERVIVDDIAGLEFEKISEQVIVPAVQMLGNASRNLFQLDDFNRATSEIAAKTK